MPLSVLVTICPQHNAKAASRLEELTPWLTEEVKKNEPWISQYHGFRTPSMDADAPEGAVDYLIYFM